MKTQHIQTKTDNENLEPVCYKCKYFESNMAGTHQKCWINFYGPQHILRLDDQYVRERINGDKLHCKYFESLENKINLTLDALH
jgi:hypothetical protein